MVIVIILNYIHTHTHRTTHLYKHKYVCQIVPPLPSSFTPPRAVESRS